MVGISFLSIGVELLEQQFDIAHRSSELLAETIGVGFAAALVARQMEEDFFFPRNDVRDAVTIF